MSLLALPDEILLYILRTIFNNAIMGIVRPRRGAASQLPIYRSNVLRITAANKRLRALAIGLLRDKESTVEYRFNALDTGYCEVPEFWTKSPFFANTIGLPLFPSQFARSTRECLLLPPSAPASTGASDHRKMVMEWKWHDHNGNFLKDPMRHLDFVWGMGKATRESSHENLVHFMQRVRRGKINGRVEVEIKWMDQVVSTYTRPFSLCSTNKVTGMQSKGDEQEA
jgi:hypothetical protein